MPHVVHHGWVFGNLNWGKYYETQRGATPEYPRGFTLFHVRQAPDGNTYMAKSIESIAVYRRPKQWQLRVATAIAIVSNRERVLKHSTCTCHRAEIVVHSTKRSRTGDSQTSTWKN